MTTLRTWVTWLLVVAAAGKTAELTWAVYQPATVAQAASVVAAPLAQREGVNLGAIQAAALFGSPAKVEAVPVKPVAQPEVKSRLAVKLLGIIHGDAGRAVAILAERNQQRAYAVGDRLQIDSRAEVVEILVDRVVIDLAGQRQFIELEAVTAGSGRAEIQPVAAASSLPDRISLAQPEIRSVLGDIREKVVSDPLSFGRFLQLRPFAENGSLTGYQLQPGRDGRLFRQLGLQPGDLVTHVEDIDITDSKNIPQLINLVQSQQRIRIGIRRGGEDQDIDVEL